jgi:hypothetical protein
VEVGRSERVACGGGADSILQFQLERGCDGMKHYRKMKRMQRAHLVSMGMKCDMVWYCDDVDRMRGSTGEEKMEETMSVGLTRILLD